MDIYRGVHDEIKERLCKWAVSEPSGPVRMVFSLTERCNFKCLYCSGILIHGGIYPEELIKKENELSKKKWIKIAKEGAKLGVKHWSVLGGEPLLRYKTLLRMIKIIKKISPESVIELNTNGWFLTPDIAKKLVLSECDLIQLSIDGSNAKTHDFLRGRDGSFDRLVNAGKQLMFMKRKYGKEKPRVHVNTVINSRNYYELPELASLAGSFEAEVFIANPMRVQSANIPWIKKENLELTKEQINQFPKIWKKVENIGKQHNIDVCNGIDVNVTPDEKTNELHEEDKSKKVHSHEAVRSFLDAFCFGPFYSLAIGATGKVGSCASSITFLSPVNIREKSLKEIWYGNYFESARKSMLNGETSLEECKTCGIITQRFNIRSQLSDLVSKKRPKIRTYRYGRELET